MLIDISLLLSNVKKQIDIEEDFSFNQEELNKVGILKLENSHVSGQITKNSIDTLSIDLTISGDMYLKCALTLKPVKHSFNIKIDDEKISDFENILKKGENILELKPFLWENIVVEIPLRVVSSDAYEENYKGNGWQLITDENYEHKNMALSSLSQLFEGEEEE